MKADAKRKSGWYWTRFEGVVMVMEYRKMGKRGPRWYAAGTDEPYEDREVCELLSDRLEPPKK